MRSRLGYRSAAMLLACAALAATFLAPQAPFRRATFRLLVTLDITQSMNTADYRVGTAMVSRLDYAKAALRNTLLRLPCGSHVGWGVFSEYRTLVLLAPVEVCANFDDLAAVLERIDGTMAWAGASEVAKGLHSGIRAARELGADTRLVFVSDGHEAPPLHPRYLPRFDGRPGEVQGLILGTGASALSPIPKFDADGRSLGFWGADEVMQTDVYSRGRASSVAGEAMLGADADPAAGRSATEHLSSLKETHLQQLAAATGLSYRRLDRPDAPWDAARQAGLAQDTAVMADLRFVPATAALLLLVLPFLLRRKRNQ